MDKTELAVSLRGLHLFTHPALLYGAINSLKPRRYLRRSLSYAERPSGTTAREAGSTASQQRRELHVCLSDLDLTGGNLPETVTLLVALCETASTGRDFKPVRAAAVSLPVQESAEQPPSSNSDAAADNNNPVGAAGLSRAQGSHGQQLQTVVLPLPQRRLTRPVLLLMVSDWHPDLQALTPAGSRPRQLSTDLQSRTKLLSLLPDPSPVWAALHPLDSVLAGGAEPGPQALRTATAAAMGPARQLALQWGQLTRSACSVTTAAGRTISATLLNLQILPGFDPDAWPMEDQPQAQVAGGGTSSSSTGAGGLAGHTGGFVFGVGSLRRPVSQHTRLSALAVGCAVAERERPAALPTPPIAAGAAAAPALRKHIPKRAVHAIQQAAGAGANGGGGPGGGAAGDADSVVQFRYVFDDPAWSGGGTTRRRGNRQQSQLQGRSERRAAGVGPGKAAGSGGPGGAGGPLAQGVDWSAADPMEVEGDGAGGGEGQDGAAVNREPSGSERAAWMQRQMSGIGGQTEPRQQQADAAGEPKSAVATTGAANGTGALLERYFVEEVRVPAGAAFTCPLCPVKCQGFKGLQVHLPSSHSLYQYAFSEGSPAAPEARSAGGTGGTDPCVNGPGGSDGGQHPVKQEAAAGAGSAGAHYVVEVRLRPDVVDPVRRDLVLPEEDVTLRRRPEEGLGLTLARIRPWAFVRAAGMRSWTYLDERGVDDQAADGAAGIGTPGPALAPAPATEAGVGAAAGAAMGGAAAAAGLGRSGSLRGRRGGGGSGGGGASNGGAAEALRGEGAGAPPGQGRRVRRRQEADELEGVGTAGPLEAGGSSGGVGAGAGAAPEGLNGGGVVPPVVEVPLRSLKQSIAAGSADSGAEAAGAARPHQLRLCLAPGVHPPGRRYFHSRSCIPGTLDELFGPYDSDDETDDEEWEASFDRHLSHTSRLTVLAAADRGARGLTSADRRFFKLWNTFARRRPIYADYVTPLRCLQFAREHGPDLQADPELRSALTVHLMLLHEFNLLDPRTLHRAALLADGRLTCSEEEDVKFLAAGRSASGRAAAGSVPASAAAAAPGANSGGGMRGGYEEESDDVRRRRGGGDGGGGSAGANRGRSAASGGGSGSAGGADGSSSGADGGDGSAASGSGSGSGDEGPEDEGDAPGCGRVGCPAQGDAGGEANAGGAADGGGEGPSQQADGGGDGGGGASGRGHMARAVEDKQQQRQQPPKPRAAMHQGASSADRQEAAADATAVERPEPEPCATVGTGPSTSTPAPAPADTAGRGGTAVLGHGPLLAEAPVAVDAGVIEAERSPPGSSADTAAKAGTTGREGAGGAADEAHRGGAKGGTAPVGGERAGPLSKEVSKDGQLQEQGQQHQGSRQGQPEEPGQQQQHGQQQQNKAPGVPKTTTPAMSWSRNKNARWAAPPAPPPAQQHQFLARSIVGGRPTQPQQQQQLQQ